MSRFLAVVPFASNTVTLQYNTDSHPTTYSPRRQFSAKQFVKIDNEGIMDLHIIRNPSDTPTAANRLFKVRIELRYKAINIHSMFIDTIFKNEINEHFSENGILTNGIMVIEMSDDGDVDDVD